MKQAKCEIEEIVDRCGDLSYLYAKGHWPNPAFLMAARDFARHNGMEVSELDGAGKDIRRTYARWVPCHSEYFDFTIHFADSPGRGTFPLTILDVA